MKIEAPKSVQTADRKKLKSPSSSGGFFSIESLETTSEIHQTQGVSSPFALEVLQGIGDEQSESVHVDSSHRVLDLLDQMRMGLLGGSLNKGALLHLSHMVQDLRQKQKQDQNLSPELSSILDDVYLRAQVELAKYDMEVK